MWAKVTVSDALRREAEHWSEVRVERKTLAVPAKKRSGVVSESRKNEREVAERERRSQKWALTRSGKTAGSSPVLCGVKVMAGPTESNGSVSPDL